MPLIIARVAHFKCGGLSLGLVNGAPAKHLLVREARPGISEEYLRSTIDYVQVNRPTGLEFQGKANRNSVDQRTRLRLVGR